MGSSNHEFACTVFQWRPFTLIRVLYEYGLPVNFTRTSSFCAGHAFMQQHKLCIHLIYTGCVFDVINYVTVKLFIIRDARLVKLLAM